VSSPRQLARRLAEIGYDAGGVEQLLGPAAASALERGEHHAARRVLVDDRSALATVVRLFLLADVVERSDVQKALGSDADEVSEMLVGDEQVRSRLELAPYPVDNHDWYVVADWSTRRTGRPTAADHVLGVGGASTMLAQCTVRRDVARALDVGTGCGVQALHLAQHAAHVVGTDISERCLELAAFTFAMNDVDVELRRGSLFDPVADESFDLIVSNPPFVIASPTDEQHVYRDSGLPGDEVCARLVGQLASRLADDGFGQLLANWEIRADEPWQAAPSSWLVGSPLDAWVVQREVQDPAAYVEMWLRDSGADRGPDYARLYDAWLSALEQRGVAGIGFGLVSVHAAGHDDPVRRFQHVAQPLAQPVGPEVEQWFRRQDVLARYPGAEVLTLALSVADDVRVDQRLRPGRAEPVEIAVLRETGFRFTGTLDRFGVALLSDLAAEPGGAPVGVVVAARAEAEGLDVDATLRGAVPVLRQLVEEGFLAP